MNKWQAALGLGLVALTSAASAQEWHFAVSGDSRNCGDIVMPAIAAGAIADHAEFYWHLGDFRAIFDFDEDMQYEREAHQRRRPTISDYLLYSWDDFIEHQLAPFGDMPVYLAIGNHELYVQKTRSDILVQFADWFDAPVIRDQRLKDDPRAHRIRTYYHWIRDGIDFITLDNATPEQFDLEQLAWFRKVIDRDRRDSSIRALVVGMHAALPDSIGSDHSMNSFPASEQSGRAVYSELVTLHKRTHKPVYLLASHSHFFMANVFDTPELRAKNAVLPGWIVGTAGAVRYQLPKGVPESPAARAKVYGYLLATVKPDSDDPIHFEFKEIPEDRVPASVVENYTRDHVHECFAGNAMK